MPSSSNNQTDVVVRTSVVTIIWNAVLSAVKLVMGLLGRSSALVSDAAHSLSDVFSTIAVIIGARLSGRDADHDHPYGHEKFEAVASLFLSAILIMSALFIGYGGIVSIIGHIAGTRTIEEPLPIALVGAGLSIVVKEVMYQYTIVRAKRVRSTSMEADAWHHRSDALSSLGSLFGIGGAMLGVLILDPSVAILIAIFILKVAFRITSHTIDELVDKAPDDATLEAVKACILKTDGVRAIDEIRMRMHVQKMYVDLEIAVDASLSLKDAHTIAERVHHEVETCFPDVKHCAVHVNPETPGKKDRPGR
jgi:cation diffusion facilitator family transporter